MKLYMYGGVLAALVLAFGVFGWRMHHAGYAAGESAGNAKVAVLTAQYAQATAKAEAGARAKERVAAVAMTQIQNTYYQQGVTDANAKADAVIAGLRAGTLRLRRQWAGCEAAASVSASSARVVSADAAAARRAESAAAIVRVGADADAQIRALQAIVKLDRQ